MSLSLAVITIALFLSPIGQSAINSWLKNKFINDFEVELSTGSLFVNPVGTTSFTDLLILDHRNDTLVFVDHFCFSIKFRISIGQGWGRPARRFGSARPIEV